MEIHIGNRVAEVELVSKEDNKVVLTIDGKPFEADVVMAENGTCNTVSYTHLTLPTKLEV